MLRLFSEHVIRPVTSLAGLWTFAATSVNAPVNWSIERPVMVPGAWETLPGLEMYRGQARYSRDFTMPHHGNARLVFGGVSHTATVSVDGKVVGTHFDAFTPWEVVLPRLDAGRHTLTVDVDNSFGDHSALHKENDYYTYGGITRPLAFQPTTETHLGWDGSA